MVMGWRVYFGSFLTLQQLGSVGGNCITWAGPMPDLRAFVKYPQNSHTDAVYP